MNHFTSVDHQSYWTTNASWICGPPALLHTANHGQGSPFASQMDALIDATCVLLEEHMLCGFPCSSAFP